VRQANGRRSSGTVSTHSPPPDQSDCDQIDLGFEVFTLLATIRDGAVKSHLVRRTEDFDGRHHAAAVRGVDDFQMALCPRFVFQQHDVRLCHRPRGDRDRRGLVSRPRFAGFFDYADVRTDCARPPVLDFHARTLLDASL
jgi:hypothetical protein